MSEHERNIIIQSIRAYERIIQHFQSKIEILNSKIQENCCFEDNQVIKIKIKKDK